MCHFHPFSIANYSITRGYQYLHCYVHWYILDISSNKSKCWIYFGYKKSRKNKNTKKWIDVGYILDIKNQKKKNKKNTKKMDRCWIYFGYKKSKISKKTHKKMDRCWIYLGYKKSKNTSFMKHLCRIPGHPSTWPLGAPVQGHTSIQRAIGGAGPCHRTPWSEELQLTPGTSMDILYVICTLQ